MPIYEFHCAACDRTFEKLSHSDVTEHPCPDCGATAAKAISIPAKGQIGVTATGAPPCAAGCGKSSGFT
ncbi:zinc ribbon domain-containing protein [Geothermobacter hydrogeniphilus]|uniref:Putative regulatory protein FmdB zinc ribbon domain-containing protein n=1 Tax=Geothermobacter hydrogeniphilus TaxID=1969733 RepID=A0A1X0YDZ0_9BACT|nr:zinc ribbon domain-containing protein [Geothermobacter hydrogeniphilus]ORJ63312.1 hypothetical protein B5V00_00135 [Geothermobacter hydrogeniphilus]